MCLSLDERQPESFVVYSPYATNACSMQSIPGGSMQQTVWVRLIQSGDAITNKCYC